MRRFKLIPILGLVALVAVACASPGASDAATPAGTAWEIVTINDLPMIEGAAPTIAFAEDGTVSGSTGCNQFNGPFVTDDRKIDIGPLATTRKACEGDVMAQERIFLEAIEGATIWAIDGGNLSLTGLKDVLGAPAG